MSDPAEHFRALLSEQLRAALAARNGEAVRTLRCVMAAIDNAGAVPLEAITAVAPRRPRRRAGA